MKSDSYNLFLWWRDCRRSDALYFVWIFWAIGLLLYVLGERYYLWSVVPIAFIFFIGLMDGMINFFRRGSLIKRASTGVTVISVGTNLEGGLKVDGDMEVWGCVTGTIELTGGVLRIVQGGVVKGEVSAPHVIINGLLDGTCTSAEVEILESGKMQGLFKGGNLSISKGGIFIGQSQSTLVEQTTSVVRAQPSGKQSDDNQVADVLCDSDGCVADALPKQA